jgi:hypothetical protein
MVNNSRPVNASAANEQTEVISAVSNNDEYISANEKITFAQVKDKEYKNNLSRGQLKKADQKKIESLIMEAQSFYADKEAIYAELESYGTYVINPSDEELTTMSQQGDVAVSTPTVYYNSWNKTWSVSCGGQWISNAWNSDNYTLPGNVGGTDGFGVGYTSVTGTYKSSVVSVSGGLTDGAQKSSSTSSRSDGDGSKGFGFRVQDYIYMSDAVTNRYVGYTWTGLCNYDSWFSNFGAVATGYYTHTYRSCNINSVSFGIEGKSAGVSVDISVKDQGFTTYGNDKRFGVMN